MAAPLERLNLAEVPEPPAHDPHLVATFGGRLRAGYSMTGGEPSGQEAIFVRLEAGEESAAISLDREVFEGGIAHEDGALTLQLGGVELVIARR